MNRLMSGGDASTWRHHAKNSDDANGQTSDSCSPKRNSKQKRKKAAAGLASSPTRATPSPSSQATATAAKGLPYIEVCLRSLMCLVLVLVKLVQLVGSSNSVTRQFGPNVAQFFSESIPIHF